MSKCNKCQTEITTNNSYTLQKKVGDNSVEVCDTCFKNNEAQYIREYVFIKGSQGIIKEPKPKIDGQETNFFECKKCGSVRNYETAGSSEFEKGCPNCQSKDFEMKISLFNGELHYKVKECSKCHKMDMADLLKWPDSDKTRGKSKKEVIKIIKQENLTNADNCQCSHNEDNNNDNPDDKREREREREQKWF